VSARAVHLLDLLQQAEVDAPEPAYVGIHRFIIARQGRMTLFCHPPASVTFPAVRLGASAVLQTGCAIKPVVWERIQSAILFTAELVDSQGRRHLLWERVLDPSSCEADRGWQACRIDLGDQAQQEVSIRLSTRVVEGGRPDWAWAGWADPTLHDQAGQKPVRRGGSARSHLLLITVDAMRGDHLGIAGGLARTPVIDALAREGFWTDHARSPSPSSIGASASILTGADPVRHRLTDEFGRLSEQLTSLPECLAESGYWTLQAPSEEDLSSPELGFGERFSQTLPCRAQPTLDADMAVRNLLAWLDSGASGDRPWMVWLHLFDLHPPHTPPLECLRPFYPHDPTDEDRRFAAERVASVQGVESVACFLNHLALLAQGRIPHELIERLSYTVRALRGERLLGPDLATHLPALAPAAFRDMPREGFLDWLEQQIMLCRSGVAPAELVDWMGQVIEMLEPVSTEILAWLDGVVDARYLPAACAGAASYVDNQLGRLMVGLDERGLADQTTVVLTSPHGQHVAEDGIALHHHLLSEPVLRVPLIIRPALNLLSGVDRGQKIEGVFELENLAATLLDLLGVQQRGGLGGGSQLPALKSGRPIAAHDSFAVGVAGTSICIRRDGFKLVRGLQHHRATPEWEDRPGELRLYQLGPQMSEKQIALDARPELVRELSARLDSYWQSRSDCS